MVRHVSLFFALGGAGCLSSFFVKFVFDIAVAQKTATSPPPLKFWIFLNVARSSEI